MRGERLALLLTCLRMRKQQLLSSLLIVKPDTVVGWYRQIVRWHWTFKQKRKPDRPRIDPEAEQLVVQIARENLPWGHTKITGEARKLGFTTRSGRAPSRSTIEEVLKNPIYTGLFQWDGQLYEGDHPPIISLELYERAQQAFRKDGKPTTKPRRVFAYLGLLKCAHCGWRITAEMKKGSYIHYHCTGYRGGCDRSYIREEQLEELLGGVVKAVAIDAEVLEWLKAALKESHRDEQAYHDRQVARLQDQERRIQKRLDAMYEDKLDGKITEEFWERKSREWRQKQLQLHEAIERHRTANQFYFDEGVRVLELAQRAYDLWLRQPQSEKRKLLDILLSNCTFDGATLLPEYRKPFCWLAEGHGCPDWLPGAGNCKNFFLWFTLAAESALDGPQGRIREDAGERRVPALVLAYEFQGLLDAGVVNTRADIARRHNVTRARVTQLMNLLTLPERLSHQ